MEAGYLAIVLHAHLPYVRHPEHPSFLEESWLFEAVTETYVPLLRTLERLAEDGVGFRLTLSITPTLAAMLEDPLLQERYLSRLESMIELAGKESRRADRPTELRALARMYRRLYGEVQDDFADRYGRRLIPAFRRLQDHGELEILASAATHGYLPLLAANPSAVRAQVAVGVDEYRRLFGRRPTGFWLPECGYYPGVDAVLAEHGLRYTVLETVGITRASPRPRDGVYRPVYCPSGVAVFGRDPESSRQVWSSIEGYPGDYDYREFYRDATHDLHPEDVRAYLHPDGIRVDSGLKYYRITGRTEAKEPYVPERAERKASLHADHFLLQRRRQIEQLATVMDGKPVVVAPYDAELFGHWWFEGPQWLESVLRRAAGEKTLRPATLGQCLEEQPVNPVCAPCPSSWGRGGSNQTWLNGKNDWIYRHLHQGARTMERLARENPRPRGWRKAALQQAGRELLLAQASDWAFMMDHGETADYAARRTRLHLSRLRRLGADIEAGRIDRSWLAEVRAQDDLFPVFDPRVFC